MITLLCGIVASYVIGSIPTGYLVGKIVKNTDIRTLGSGNLGATNVFRSIGKKWGIVVLLLDMLKGYVAVAIITSLFQSDFLTIPYLKILYGVCAICGHNWTLFLKFKGGKGVATSCGVILSMFPKALGLGLVVFVIVVYLTRYVSLGSIIGALCFPIFLYLCYRGVDGFGVYFGGSLLLVAFIVVRHHSNIKRLIKGEEHKMSFSRKKTM